MFDNEEQDGELKAFEASLGGLRPRADGLDRRMRFLLAQEATLNRDLQDSEVQLGRQFVCVRCGGVVANPNNGKRRWAWPTAFSGMTAVATALLMMLVLRAGPQNPITTGDQRTALPFASAEGPADSVVSLNGNGLPRRPVSAVAETSYLNLRDQVIRFGVESWRPPVEAIATMSPPEPPLSYRKQLDRLLSEEHFHGI
jgi:hypothetical protein